MVKPLRRGPVAGAGLGARLAAAWQGNGSAPASAPGTIRSVRRRGEESVQSENTTASCARLGWRAACPFPPWRGRGFPAPDARGTTMPSHAAPGHRSRLCRKGGARVQRRRWKRSGAVCGLRRRAPSRPLGFFRPALQMPNLSSGGAQYHSRWGRTVLSFRLHVGAGSLGVLPKSFAQRRSPSCQNRMTKL